MPIDNRIVVDKIEFYITNVCNLNCTNCNRYNNYNFKGWQNWKDYEHIYAAWAKKIKIKNLVILGGEPLLNPSICEWIYGLSKLWTSVQIVTNGTHLNTIPGFYDAVRKTHSWVQVSIHNKNDIEKHIQNIKSFLPEPLKFFDNRNVLNEDGISSTFGADFAFRDRYRITVAATLQDSFYDASIYKNNTGNLTLHNNDPVQAHSECGMVKYKNYHFIRGKLYKCGPVALMPEFDQQHKLDISDQDRQLLSDYRPLSIDEFDQRGEEFIKNIDNVIPQCKFCPVNLANIPISATIKNKKGNSTFKILHK
jgi:organic radical activating enzyme